MGEDWLWKVKSYLVLASNLVLNFVAGKLKYIEEKKL